jgi:release factor glutamine methyltransferase
MNSFLQSYLNELKVFFSNPELELRILLKNSSIKKKDIILSNFEVKDIDTIKFNNAFQRRIKREPISKIFNYKNFWKYNFYVNCDVLDPRPETELIVEKILEFYPKKDQSLKILDMCTGSGCLAITLAKEYSKAKVIGTDISSKALEIAKFNAHKLNCINQIDFLECNLLENFEIFDIVVSNPPYLSEFEYDNTSSEIQLFEPKISLIAANEGLEFYQKIANILPNILNKNSRAFFEIGSKQAKETIAIFRSKNLKCLKIVNDMQNLNRVLILKKC